MRSRTSTAVSRYVKTMTRALSVKTPARAIRHINNAADLWNSMTRYQRSLAKQAL